MIEEALYNYLTGHGALSALVGDRVYPNVAPARVQGAHIVVQRVSTMHVQTRDQQEGDSSLSRPRLQLDCYDAGKPRSLQVAETLRGALIGFRQSGPPRVDIALLEGDDDGYDSKAKLFYVSVDAFVWFSD